MWAYVKLSLSRIKGGDKKLLAHTPEGDPTCHLGKKMCVCVCVSV